MQQNRTVLNRARIAFFIAISPFLTPFILSSKSLELSSYFGEISALDNMEERSVDENPLQFMSFSLGGSTNDPSCVSKYDPSRHYTMGYGMIEDPPTALSLSQWYHGQTTTSHSYVKFLEESTTFLPKAQEKDTVDSIPLAVGSMHAVNGVSEIPSDFLYNNLANAYGFKLSDSSLVMDAWKENLSIPVLSNDHEASTSITGLLHGSQNKVTCLNLQNEGVPVNKFTCTQYQICAQGCTSRTQELCEENFHVAKHDSRVSIVPPCFELKQRSSTASRQKAAATDRRRRLKIAERLKALQALLPHPEKRNKASAMDDIIDHIKNLQLQIKNLSQSRLGGDSTSDPFIFLEGYGHYLLHDQMLREPLEEMMGKLMEVNPPEATQLLEDKGLYVLPMTMVEGLFQSI